MPRLTLDITRQQHQQLKTLSSYAGISMRDFILTRVFTNSNTNENIFAPKNKAAASEKELAKLQKNFFKKSEVIVLSESNWKEFKEHLAKNKITADSA